MLSFKARRRFLVCDNFAFKPQLGDEVERLLFEVRGALVLHDVLAQDLLHVV